MRHREDLQVLRAIAVMLVVFAHAGVPFFSGGFIGVDLFFVLSGYLISAQIIEDKTQGRFSLLLFYTKRIKRLSPALFLVALVVVVFASFLLSSIEAREQLMSLPHALSWTSNIFFASREIDYFNYLSASDLFLHTWSLGVEEQFYIVWPLILTFSLFISKEIRFGSITFLSLVVLASFLVSCYFIKSYPNHVFYQAIFRLWQFGLGTLVYLILSYQYAPAALSISRFFDNKVACKVLSFFSLASILICGALYNENIAYPGIYAVVPSLSAAAFILSGSNPKHLHPFLKNDLLVWIGDRSYSIYLWHWPIFIIGFSFGYKHSVVYAVLALCLCFVLSNLTYKYVELPFWKGRFRDRFNGDPARLVVYFLASVVFLHVAAKIYLFYQKIETFNPESVLATKNDLPAVYQMGCDRWYYDDQVVDCLIDGGRGNKQLVLLGDSIGLQWFSAFLKISRDNDWSLRIYTKSACPIVDKEIFYARIKKEYTVCSSWREKVISELKQLKPDMLVLGSASSYAFDKDEWISGSKGIIAKLGKDVKQIVIIPGTPVLSFDGPICLARPISKSFGKPLQLCYSDVDDRSRMVSGYLELLAQDFEHVDLLNLNDLVCSVSEGCQAINEQGIVVFRDSQHLTNSFVESKSEEIEQRFLNLISK